MESSTRETGAKKPQCTVLHEELLASPSHWEVIIEKQTRIFQSMGRSTKTQSQEIPYILESNPHTFNSLRGQKIRCGLESHVD
jgi:hypothetical protein